MILSKSQAVAKTEHMIPLRYSTTLGMHSHEELPSIHNIEESNNSGLPSAQTCRCLQANQWSCLQAKQDIIYGNVGPCCDQASSTTSVILISGKEQVSPIIDTSKLEGMGLRYINLNPSSGYLSGQIQTHYYHAARCLRFVMNQTVMRDSQRVRSSWTWKMPFSRSAM